MRTQTAEGATLPGVGTILYPSGAPTQRAMVDEHERLHMELNACTSFGILLSVVGTKGVDFPEPHRVEVLGTLVDLCRTTHEVYATTVSVWQMPADERPNALRDYPSYERFLRIGELLGGAYPPESMVAHALVVSACLVAMQVPLGLALAGRRNWGSTALDLSPSYRPDARLRELLTYRDLDFSWIEHQVDQQWRAGYSADPYGDFEFKRVQIMVLIRAYHQYAWALGRGDIPVLPWDGHLHYVSAPVYSSVEAGRFESQHPTNTDLVALRTATEAASDVHHIIRSSERQSLRRATFGRPVYFNLLRRTPPSSATNWTIQHFVNHDGPSCFHVMVRPVEALISSYVVPDERAAALQAAANDGIVTAVRRVVRREGQVATFLGLMTSSDDLALLLTAATLNDGFPPSAVSSISTSCLFSRQWRDEWLTALRLATEPVLLADLPPSIFLKGERDPDGFDFAGVSVEERAASPGMDPIRGVAIGRHRAEGTIERYVVFMGGDVLINNFELRLADLPGATPNRESIAKSPATLVMLHLGRDEPEFHFRGLSYFAPSALEEPAMQPGEVDRWTGLARDLRSHQLQWIEHERSAGRLPREQ
jgi:hypothetical protein